MCFGPEIDIQNQKKSDWGSPNLGMNSDSVKMIQGEGRQQRNKWQSYRTQVLLALCALIKSQPQY